MVIRDLFSVTFEEETHTEVLEEEHAVFDITFKLGVASEEHVVVMVFANGVWNAAPAVVNNGDGTVTVTLEDVGPIVFCVRNGTDNKPSETGDAMDLTLWIVLLSVSAVALVAVVCFRRRFV